MAVQRRCLHFVPNTGLDEQVGLLPDRHRLRPKLSVGAEVFRYGPYSNVFRFVAPIIVFLISRTCYTTVCLDKVRGERAATLKVSRLPFPIGSGYEDHPRELVVGRVIRNNTHKLRFQYAVLQVLFALGCVMVLLWPVFAYSQVCYLRLDCRSIWSLIGEFLLRF